ncbi:hypothetical protein JNW90_01295 [Micromonospora sp. STR1s_5]|nr:hypothetical protein [Micromonospora sp. STR1s_5]
MAINWPTFGAAVLTAVTITVVVELLVKPRIQALLELRTIRRELMARMVSLTLAAGLLTEDLPKDMSREVREHVREEQRRQAERLNAAVRDLFDQAGRYVAVYGGPLRTLTVDYIVCLHGLMLSTRTRSRKAQIIKELAAPVATALDPERQKVWYVWHNVQALRTANRLIIATHSDQVTEDQAPLEDPEPAAPATRIRRRWADRIWVRRGQA